MLELYLGGEGRGDIASTGHLGNNIRDLPEMERER